MTEEMQQVRKQGALTAMIGAHKMMCNKHHPNPDHICGLLAYSALTGEVRCRWCNCVETVGTAPASDAAVEDVNKWLCGLISTGERMDLLHRACIPDPARNGVKARLMSTVTADGVNDLNDDVTVGDEYIVYPHTRRPLQWGHESRPGQFTVRESMYVDASKHGRAGFMPCELFDCRTQ
jgi:hypothetical protein